jgi:diguanylate cyclase (GGDEF)-like protein
MMLLAFLRSQQQGRIMHIENQQRLWQLANHDALTGLPNRMLLLDRLVQLLARMSRKGKRMAVLFLDIDGFKQVNDSYGHEVGDQLLKFVAERLHAAVRVDDTVARMSGDEFIFLIESAETEEALDAVQQQIQEKLSDGFPIEGKVLHVRVSIGIARFPEDGNSPEALIKFADGRMYADKKAPRSKASPGLSGITTDPFNCLFTVSAVEYTGIKRPGKARENIGDIGSNHTLG